MTTTKKGLDIHPDIYRTLKYFHGENAGEVYEICAINPVIAKHELWGGERIFGKDRIVAGWFNDIQKACEIVAKLDVMGCEGIYHTPNPCNDGLLSRAGNRLKANADRTTNNDIDRVRWILIDVDPKRPAGISSTDAECEHAIAVTKDISDFLVAQGWSESIRTGSGNGGHLAIPTDMPNDRETEEILKGLTHALDWKFGGTAANGIKVEVDKKVFNSARIFKIYGTWARKGDNTKVRPHRLSRILYLPEGDRVEVSKEQIISVMELLAKEAPEYTPGSNGDRKGTQARASRGRGQGWDGGQQKPMDVEGYLAHYGRAVTKTKTHGESTLFVLKECVFDSSHNGGEASVGITPDGKLFYQCFHNSCEGRTWKEAREIISGDDSLAQWIPDFKPKTRDGGKSQKNRPKGSQASDSPHEDAITIIDGTLPEIVRQCLEKMRQEAICYDRNGELVRISKGSVYPVTVDWLRLHLTEVAAFQKYDARSEGWKYCNCTADIAKTVASMSGLWELPPLNGIMTCPTITPTGRVIEEHGYDQETGVFLHFPEPMSGTWEKVKQEPTMDDVRVAIKTIWEPFKEFPFESAVDRGGCLSAIFTTILRPFLGTAPGVLIESPVAGSGKTKLAQSIAALSGSDGSVVSKSEDEEEMRKSLLAMSRVCTPCIIMDNISGTFKSDSLCAFLTSGMIVSRVLGASEMIQGKSSSMMLFTGNNPTILGDLNRRMLRIKINPQMEKPYLRTFDFDPVEYIVEHRLAIVRAAITVLRAAHLSGWRHNVGRLASFEAWSDIVRNAVIWFRAHDLTGDIDVEDPVASIEASYEIDPETRDLSALLETWFDLFLNEGGTVAESIALAQSDPDTWNVLYNIAGEKGSINPRKLGNWIQAHEHRIADGAWFTRKGTYKRAVRWVVAKKEKSNATDNGNVVGHSNVIQLAQRSNLTNQNIGSIPSKGELGELRHSVSSNTEKCQHRNNDITHKRVPANSHNSTNSPSMGEDLKNGKYCSECVNFTPNQTNTKKPGTCPVDPEGKYVKLPREGEQCPRFERVTG